MAMIDTPWEQIDYSSVCDQYNKRITTHHLLKTFLDKPDIPNYVQLALGIEDHSGNYSAAKHGLGPIILAHSTHEQVFALAKKLSMCQSPNSIPDIIYQHDLPHLKISVGSEMAMMLRPNLHWVTNTRTLWAYFVLHSQGSTDRANEILRLSKDRPEESPMNYDYWKEWHPLVGSSLIKLGELGTQAAYKQGKEPGDKKYLWADAIADQLYAKFS